MRISVKRHIILVTLMLAFVQLLAQTKDSLKTVVAGKGDGIYKLLRENGYVAKDYYNDFLELNRSNIADEDGLIQGKTYFLPPQHAGVAPAAVEPAVVDEKLKGAYFYIISGHGGPDPGAVSTVDGHKISEDEYAYDICLRLATNLQQHAATVFMIINDPNDGIRDDRYLKLDYDEYCYPDAEIPREQNQRLRQRADAVNDLYAKYKRHSYHRTVVLHLDSRSNGKRVDVFFYHYPNSKKGKTACQCIQRVFQEKYDKHQPNRGYSGTVSSRTLLVMKKVLPPVIFMELGNIQNARDRKRFLDPNNRQALANWITDGLINDYAATKK